MHLRWTTGDRLVRRTLRSLVARGLPEPALTTGIETVIFCAGSPRFGRGPGRYLTHVGPNVLAVPTAGTCQRRMG